MYAEAKKIHLIEEILKIETDDLLVAEEDVIHNHKHKIQFRKSFKDFVGTISSSEAKELENIIKQGCEIINEDDWK